MSVPERELLIAVHDIARVIDIQRHRRRWGRIAGTVNADHRDHHPGQFTRGRCILPAAHRRLAGQPRARSRQLAQRQAEARSSRRASRSASSIATHREHTGTQNVIEAMDHPRRVTRIGDARSKLPADPHRALGLRQAERRRQRSAGHRRTVVTFLPPTAGNENPGALSSLPAGVVRGINCLLKDWSGNTHFPTAAIAYATPANPLTAAVNKRG
jgi:hypothetical protein